jgi:hypothetical protein
MKRSAFLIASVLFGASAGGAALADEKTGQAEQQPSVKSGTLMTTKATVQKVDLDKRELTVKGTDGKPLKIDVPKDVTGLENVKAGDQLDVAFYQSVAMSLKKADEATGTQTKTMEQPGTGAMPSGTMGKQVTANVKVVKVDHDQNQLTIQTPSGDQDTINVRDAQNQAALQKLKPGDQLRVTYSEAMAASIRKG